MGRKKEEKEGRGGWGAEVFVIIVCLSVCLKKCQRLVPLLVWQQTGSRLSGWRPCVTVTCTLRRAELTVCYWLTAKTILYITVTPWNHNQLKLKSVHLNKGRA